MTKVHDGMGSSSQAALKPLWGRLETDGGETNQRTKEKNEKQSPYLETND